MEPTDLKNILIVENEQPAAAHLNRLVRDILLPRRRPKITTLESVAETIGYLQESPMPDIIFLDIHLSDGTAFRIFDSVHPTCPVVFTTAYDQYALEAFRVGGIDYLLKPINRIELQRTLDRIGHISPLKKENVSAAAERMSYHTHLLLPENKRLVPIDTNNIACLYIESKQTQIHLLDGTIFKIDRTLDSIFQLLDPKMFFRVNRQFVVAHAAIKGIDMWPLSRLRLELTVPSPREILVSKVRVAEFKAWFMG